MSLSRVTITSGEIEAIGHSPFNDVTALELRCPPKPGLTYRCVGINLGTTVIGQSVTIEHAIVPQENHSLSYIVSVTVGEEEPHFAVYDQARWVEIIKTTEQCKAYDFPWLRSYWG